MMPNSLKIEQVNLRHLTEISRIERESFPDPWNIETFKAKLSDPSALFFTALEQDRLLGYGLLQLMGPEAELYNIAVDSSQRGRGVGKALLSFLLDAGRKAGVEAVHLEVRASNEAAVQLYRSLGFATVGLRKGYYYRPKEDAILMTYTQKELFL